VGQKGERKRNKKKKKERKRQGNCHFNQPYLSGFCVVLYVGALKARREKKLLLLLQVLMN
jgi:hypothetical protein